MHRIKGDKTGYCTYLPSKNFIWRFYEFKLEKYVSAQPQPTNLTFCYKPFAWSADDQWDMVPA
jgi:hypothetical protein